MDYTTFFGTIHGSHYTCGAKGPNHVLGLGLWPRTEQSEDEWMVMNVSSPGPNERNIYGRMVLGGISPRIR